MELNLSNHKVFNALSKVETGLNNTTSVDGYANWALLATILGQQLHSTLDKGEMLTIFIST